MVPYRRNYLLKTSQGDWIAKKISDVEHANWWIQVDQQLRQRGFHQMPSVRVVGKWMLTPFLLGKTCSYSNLADVKKVMRILAQFHLAGQELSVPPIREAAFLLMDRLYERLRQFYHLLRKAPYIPGELGELLITVGPEFYHIGWEAWNRIRLLPLKQLVRKQRKKRYLCHRDLASHNWLKDDKGEFWLIDFETANYDAQIGDVWQLSSRALTINHWQDEFVQEVVQVYEKVAPLDIWEKEILRHLFYFPNEFYRESIGLAKRKPGYHMETSLPYLKGIASNRYRWLQKAGEIFV
jgi:CotS family spore coat protein